ncbi:site-2 protease family protein [Streptomyces tagetis]|uniref:Site-2 protease family protein n=1 Tax=Streptomyces tagetis TaxID=2820809 RepID=A0A940XRI5_9ACTN|nr:site-2 protease family protein [Streptomyces sp. RG38]MBQ0829820.1 site-2 protease family protein [Streptomyces sp. RG38]
MNVSGGSGHPRSGNDQPAGPHTGPGTPAAGPGHPDPTNPRAATGHPDPTNPRAATGGTDGPERPEGPDRGAREAEDTGEPAGTGGAGETGGTGGAGGTKETGGAEGTGGTGEPGGPGGTGGPGGPGGTRGPGGTAGTGAPGSPQRPGDHEPPARHQHPGGHAGPIEHPTPGAPRSEAHTPDGPHGPHGPGGPVAPRSEAHTPDGPHGPHGPGGPVAPRSEAHAGGDGEGPGKPPQRPEPRGGLLMGRIFGVPVYVAPSWFLVAILITWVFGGQLERVLPELGAARYLVSLFFAVAFYASVLIHELAHTVAALRFKLPVRRIQLQFFGGVSEIEKEAETPGREFVLAFVGPLLSLVLAGVFYGALLGVEPGTVPGVLLAGLMISNLIVAVFNLLPGLPLDGGRMLRAVVWKITGKPMSGTVAAAWVGRALAVSVLIGLPLLTQSGALGSPAQNSVGMDTVMDALLAAILAAIIWTGAGNSLRMARLREHLPELRARALTRRAVPVPGDTPLSEALRRANTSGARALVVVDGEGHPVSLVREAAIVGVPEHRRPWVAVSTLAHDITEGMRVSADLSGEELLDALRTTPATEYLVVEESGAIYGVLSAADVEKAFVKAMARPS